MTAQQIAALRLAVTRYGTACIQIGATVGTARDEAHADAAAKRAEVDRLIDVLTERGEQR